MKKQQYYFEDEDAEICYTKDYFLDRMRNDGITEMEVLEAVPDKIDSIFWCKKYGEIGDRDYDAPCGKGCDGYAPRNRKSGCCKHYTNKVYSHGIQTTLTL